MNPYGQARAIAGTFFVLGFGAMLSISMFRENQLEKTHAAAMTESAVRSKQLADLHADALARVQACQEREIKRLSHETVLTDIAHPGQLWIIPGEVEPKVYSPVPGMYYGYTDDDGKLGQQQIPKVQQ